MKHPSKASGDGLPDSGGLLIGEGVPGAQAHHPHSSAPARAKSQCTPCPCNPHPRLKNAWGGKDPNRSPPPGSNNL